jgi:hypothetical protein
MAVGGKVGVQPEKSLAKCATYLVFFAGQQLRSVDGSVWEEW